MPERRMLSVQAKPDIAGIRTAEFRGAQHTVIPTIALLEGVLWPANAAAPELALAEEFGRFPAGWDGRPVVYDHPRVNGEPVPASSPGVLEASSVGQLFNTKLDGKKLKTEIWIDNARVKDLSDEIQEAIERLKSGDEVVEVSTGLFSMTEAASGEYEGEAFEAIWRNIVPDHLAILPEGIVGACSVKDGCGAPRTNQMKPVMRAAELRTSECSCDTPETTENREGSEEEEGEKKGAFQRLMEAAGNLFRIKDNSENLSDVDTRTAIQSALSNEESYFWIMAVFDGGDSEGTFIYESFESGKLYERTFMIDSDGNITIGAEKTEVRPVTQFVPTTRPTENSDSEEVTENTDGSIQENRMNPKDQLVQGLIDNESTQFTEDDRDWLSALDETQLAKLSPAEVEDPPTANRGNDTDTDTDQGKPVSTEDYIAKAPEEVQQVLNSGLKMHRARKSALVANLVANSRCKFTKEQLESKQLEELEAIVALTGSEVSYEGAGISLNSAGDDENVAPEPPLCFVPNSKRDAA